MKSALIAVLLGPSLCLASPKISPADDDLIGPREEGILRALKTASIPTKPELVHDKDANLVITVGAAYTEVFLTAKPEGAARGLAQDLAESLDGTPLQNSTVEYSSEDEYAVAKVVESKGNFGALRGENTLPAGDIASRLRSKGWDVALVVRTPGYVAKEDNGLAYQHSSNWNYYAALKPVAGTAVHVSVPIPAAGRIAFFAFLGLPGAVCLISLLLAFAYASTKSIPLETRRKNYPKFAIRPTFIAIGLHMPLALYFLVSRGCRPYADVWMGSGSAASMMPFMMAPLPVIFLMLPLSTVFEKKLFGPRPGEPTTPKVVISPEEAAVRKQMARVSAIPMFVALTLLMASNFLPRQFTALRLIVFVPVLIAIAGRPLIERRYKTRLASFDAPSEAPALELRARDVASRMGTTFKKLRIDGSILGRQSISGIVLFSDVVKISHRATEALTEGELDALIAHELAHIRLGHTRVTRLLLIVVVALFVLNFVGMQIVIWLHASIPMSLIMLPMFLAFPIAFFGVRSRFGRQREFNADRLAVETTRDPASYPSMLQKLSMNSAMPAMHENEVGSTHPAISKRIAAVAEWAFQHGYSGTATPPNPSPAGTTNA